MSAARTIVQEAEEAIRLREQSEELQVKAGLLQSEIEYTQKLEYTLGQIQTINVQLQHTKEATEKGRINVALEELLRSEAGLATLHPWETSHAVDMLGQRSTRLRKELVETVERTAGGLIMTEKSSSRVVILQETTIGEEKQTISLPDTIDVCSKLHILDPIVERFCEDLDDVMLRRRFSHENAPSVPRITAVDNVLQIHGEKKNTGANDVIEDVLIIARFLHKHLPPQISVSISEILVQKSKLRLLAAWLPAALPLSVDDTGELEILLTRVKRFAEELSEIGWVGSILLNEWVEEVPRNWFSKRRQWSLDNVRSLLAQQVKQTKKVERIETQIVSHDDVMVSANHDAWDAAWSEEESNEMQAAPPPTTESKNAHEDEDASAWEVEVEDDALAPVNSLESPREQASKSGNEDEEEGDAWGWNEENASVPSSPITLRKEIPQASVAEILHNGTSREPRRVTLKETYRITMVPERLLSLIANLVRDSDTLRGNTLASRVSIASAATGLYSLPTLVIATFRALAPSSYATVSTLPGTSNMYMYNDASYLAEALSSFSASHSSQDQTSRLRLDADISALQAFARRAYGREMDAQRTILRDLLDGVQGFTNSTQAPFAAACADAISATVARVREVAEAWTGVLGRGTLLQSLGSLLGTIVTKTIIEIEELDDIAEVESVQLRGFVAEICGLRDLFTTTADGVEGDSQDMTAVYTPQWLKFQYLGELLEASLADIKYLWQEGELSLEFEQDEVIDLLTALFSDSDYRRRAIADVRRSPGLRA